MVYRVEVTTGMFGRVFRVFNAFNEEIGSAMPCQSGYSVSSVVKFQYKAFGSDKAAVAWIVDTYATYLAQSESQQAA